MVACCRLLAGGGLRLGVLQIAIHLSALPARLLAARAVPARVGVRRPASGRCRLPTACWAAVCRVARPLPACRCPLPLGSRPPRRWDPVRRAAGRAAVAVAAGRRNAAPRARVQENLGALLDLDWPPLLPHDGQENNEKKACFLMGSEQLLYFIYWATQ